MKRSFADFEDKAKVDKTAVIESLVAKMLEHAANGTKGVVFMDSIYWND